MNRRRAAATCLLVFCLAVSAIASLASPSFSVDDTATQPPLGLSAPDAALACILGAARDSTSSPELQPAITGLRKSLRVFVGYGGLVCGSHDRALPTLVASAEAIRGPPGANHS